MAGFDVRVPMTRLSLAVFKELAMICCCTWNAGGHAVFANLFQMGQERNYVVRLDIFDI